MRGRSIHTSNKQLISPHRIKRDIHRYDQQEDTYRDIRTASQTNKIRFSKKIMVANKQIIPQDLRNVSILHKKTQSEGQGSVIMLPKNLEQARQPKLKRQISSQEGELQQQGPQKQSSLEKSSRWVDFSRKNLQQITTRLKTIRNLKYSNHIVHNEGEMQTIKKLSETSLACKSLQPIRAATPGMQQLDFINELQNKRYSKNQILRKKQSQKMLRVQYFEEKLRQKSKSSLGNEFHARLKKKCLQNNPHILASVIKRKNLEQDKIELYQFVQKIIQKSKKH